MTLTGKCGRNIMVAIPIKYDWFWSLMNSSPLNILGGNWLRQIVYEEVTNCVYIMVVIPVKDYWFWSVISCKA